MKRIYVIYKLIEHSNGSVLLQKVEHFLKRQNAQKYIKELSGDYIILTKYTINT